MITSKSFGGFELIRGAASLRESVALLSLCGALSRERAVLVDANRSSALGPLFFAAFCRKFLKWV